MPFPADERATLLALKGVGPGVVARLEQMGIVSLAALACADANENAVSAAALTGSTCWKNSPQARAAITAAITAARTVTGFADADKALPMTPKTPQ